jgi:hypothetical protein
MRTVNTQLPSSDELWQILEKESPRRAVKFDYIALNSGVFHYYRKLAQDTNWVVNYASMSLEDVVRHANETNDELTSAILSGRVHRGDLDELYRSLASGTVSTGQRGAPGSADAIFVFGSPADHRINLAIEYFFRNAAPKIIVSGKGPHYQESHVAEALRMKDVAMRAGVPEPCIIVEPDSVTLPDNVKRSLDLFDEMQWRPMKLIIIATTFVLRRAYMEWYKFTPWDIEIISTSPKPPADMHVETWSQSERGVRMLLNEYAKMVIEHKMDREREKIHA